MKGDFLNYWSSLWRVIPIYVWEAEISILILGTVAFFLWKGWEKGFCMSLSMLLVVYVVIVYCSTVLFRATGSETGYNYMPFWSYGAILEGRDDLIAENMMNILVFVPVGFLISAQISCVPMTASDYRSSAPKGWLVAFLVGAGISLSIETFQYFLHRGFSEVDDVIHNTIGCVLGYILFKGLQVMVLGRTKR